MHVRNFAFLSLTGLLALLPAAAPAQSGSFAVTQHGHPVGTASYQFTGTSQGYDSTSVVRIAMQGLDYSISKTEELSPANRLRHVQLSAVLNGKAVNIVGVPIPPRSC